MKLGVLILAAGKSSRMGRPKQLLLFKNKTLIEHCIETVLNTRYSSIFTVLGAHADVITKNISSYPIETLHNPDYSKGLSSSIKIGIHHIESQGFDAVLILLADQPHITSIHLNALINQFKLQQHIPVATAYPKGFGVPAIFPKSYFNRLKSLTGDTGAKGLLNSKTDTIKNVAFNNLIDIDTPEDYNNLLNLSKT